MTDAATKPYTETQATDEAVRVAFRRLQRKQPAAHAALMADLPDWMREVLDLADVRADRLRATDERDGTVRQYVSAYELADDGPDNA